MSHNGNTELLLCLFEEEIETVQKRFPKLTNAQTEHVAAKRAEKTFLGESTMKPIQRKSNLGNLLRNSESSNYQGRNLPIPHS